MQSKKCGYCCSYTRDHLKKIFAMSNVKRIKYECPRHGVIELRVPKIDKIVIPETYVDIGLKCNLCGNLCCDYTGEAYGDIYTSSIVDNIPKQFKSRIKFPRVGLDLDGNKKAVNFLLVEDEPCPFLSESLCSFYFIGWQNKRHPLCISSPFNLSLRGRNLYLCFTRPHERCSVELIRDEGKHLRESLRAWFNWIENIMKDLSLKFNPPPTVIKKTKNWAHFA